MDVLLQKHEAKHIYKVPEGLRELCSDISREVLRSQPANLYAFIAEYVDTLLITRENTKVAVKVVNNILLGSQAILCILYRTGFTLEQIAVAAPRIQKAFREYLDAVDVQPVQICDDQTCDDRSMASIRNILESTGASQEIAERAATVIQAAFRGHYERMALNEAQGKVQWQRAVTNTLDILKKAGATQVEISKALRHIKFAYRGYYSRRNQRIDAPGTEDEPLKKDERILEPVEAIQAVAWMEMMYKDSGLTLDKANEAATVIQRAYKKYKARRRCYDVQKLESSKTMVAQAIIDNLHHRIFTKVMSREDIPTEFGTREEMISQSGRIQLAFKDHLRMTRFMKEGHLEHGEYDEEEEEEEEDEEEEEQTVIAAPPPKPKYRPIEERLPKQDIMEELLPSEAETTSEHLTTSPELQSETEPQTETEFEEDTNEEQARVLLEADEEEQDDGQVHVQEEHNVTKEPIEEEAEEQDEATKEENQTDTEGVEEREEKEEEAKEEKEEAEEETKVTPETGGVAAE